MENNQTNETSESPEVVRRLRRDLVKAASTLSVDEARYLVDAYYAMQEYRKAAGNQVRALAESEEPHGVIQWLFDQNTTVEKQILRALDSWTDALPAARWAKSICGIGPVISAGLAAHIDITRSATVGHIWRFAGLDPTVEWKKGEKRPWNAGLKTLCWKIGESFVKVSGNESDFYGKLYIQRKQYEQQRNDVRRSWLTRPRANWSGSRSARAPRRTRRTLPGSSRPPTSTLARSGGRSNCSWPTTTTSRSRWPPARRRPSRTSSRSSATPT